MTREATPALLPPVMYGLMGPIGSSPSVLEGKRGTLQQEAKLGTSYFIPYE